MPVSPRRGAAAIKVTFFWTTFVVGTVLGLAILGTHPKHVAREVTASVAGIVLDEMAERGLIPASAPPADHSNGQTPDSLTPDGQTPDVPITTAHRSSPSSAVSSPNLPPRRPAQAQTKAARKKQRASAAQANAQATLRYWNALNDVMAEEANLRRPPAQLSQANAEGFLTARIRASQFAARAMQQLDRADVDRDVISHARRIATWYGKEVVIAQRGRALMGGSVGSQTATRADTETYKSDEKAHGRDLAEINRSSRSIRREMIDRYGIEFPELL